MDLTNLFSKTSPSVIGFITKLSKGPDQPHFPEIFGTGFVADSSGIAATNRHVIEAFNSLRTHPETGESTLAAILSFPSDDKGWHICFVDVLDSVALYEFSPKDKSSEWYGNAVPDIGFVQLAVCEVPSLELALEKFYLTIGMDVATIGYPMGTRSMTALGKLNQTSPFIRRGIVSSLFPYPTSKPHGFTMDIMQQGGSSGSPILRVSDGVVVGLMSSSVVEWTAAESESVSLAYSLNTNISIAEPAHILHQALAILRKSGRFKVGKLPTFSELKEECSKSDGNYELTWDTFRSK